MSLLIHCGVLCSVLIKYNLIIINNFTDIYEDLNLARMSFKIDTIKKVYYS